MGRGRAYQKSEDLFIQSSYLPIPDIASHLGRSYDSVAGRIQYLKAHGKQVEDKDRKIHKNKGIKISQK